MSTTIAISTRGIPWNGFQRPSDPLPPPSKQRKSLRFSKRQCFLLCTRLYEQHASCCVSCGFVFKGKPRMDGWLLQALGQEFHFRDFFENWFQPGTRSFYDLCCGDYRASQGFSEERRARDKFSSFP